MSWFRAKDFESVDMTFKLLGPSKDQVEKQQTIVFQSILFGESSSIPKLLEPDPTKARCKLCFTTLSNPESIENQTCRACSKSVSSSTRPKGIAQQSCHVSCNVRPVSLRQSTNTKSAVTKGKTKETKETKKAKINYVCKTIYKTQDGKSRCPSCKLTGTTSGRKTTLCSFCTKRFNKRKMFCHHCKATMVNVEKFHLCGSCFVPYCNECSEMIKMKKFQTCLRDSTEKNENEIKISKCCESQSLIEFNKDSE